MQRPRHLSAHKHNLSLAPSDVVRLIEISRATMRKMYQSLVWATDYNLVATPLPSHFTITGRKARGRCGPGVTVGVRVSCTTPLV